MCWTNSKYSPTVATVKRSAVLYRLFFFAQVLLLGDQERILRISNVWDFKVIVLLSNYPSPWPVQNGFVLFHADGDFVYNVVVHYREYSWCNHNFSSHCPLHLAHIILHVNFFPSQSRSSRLVLSLTFIRYGDNTTTCTQSTVILHSGQIPSSPRVRTNDCCLLLPAFFG